jgi:hypothetical protein
MRRRGHRILLDPSVKAKHLKRWTFWNIVSTDVLRRGIPWTELILRDRNMPDDLNLRISQRISVGLVYVALLLALACAFYWRGVFIAPLFALLFFVLGRYWLDPLSRQSWTLRLVTGSLLGGIILTAWAMHFFGLIPLVLVGASALAAQHRSAQKKNPWVRAASLTVIAGCLIATAVFYLPYHPLLGALALTLLALVVLNSEFYLFLAGRRGRSFALAAIPLHLLYHAYNGVSFVAGAIVYFVKRPANQPEVGALKD